MRLTTLCTNRQRCCLPLHMAVRLTPSVDSVQVWTCYNCYAIVESVWSEVVFVRCVTKMDRRKFEQRCAIKFCVKLGESATVTYEKFQRAYGEHSLSRAQVVRWHKSFIENKWKKNLVREELHPQKRTAMWKSEVSCEVRSSIDVKNDQQWAKFESVYRPSNFNTGFGHEKYVRQDGSKEPRDWTEGQSEGCVSWSSGPPWEGTRILQSRYHR